MRILSGIASLLLLLACAAPLPAATSVLDVGLKADGQTDNSAALQKAFTAGQRELHFPPGEYLLGTVELPENVRLSFSPQARIKVAVDKIKELEAAPAKDSVRPLFCLKGDRIAIEGLDADGVFDAQGKDSRGRARAAVNHLIFGEDVADITFRQLRVVLAEKKDRGAPNVIHLRRSRDIVLCESRFENIMHGILAESCQNVSVHGNRALFCNTLTTFTQSEGLRHYDNWSRRVIYQCVFRGGSPDPSRKAPRVPLGSAATVVRGIDPQQEGYSPHIAGTYDIQISNNYAEYARTLAWGNKARQVIFSGNVSRFMNDYSYGVEGCENVVFANNISINAKSVGIMSMYWGEKLVLTGNLVIVRDEPYRQEYSQFPEQKAYWGGLLRFHHGPRTAEDTAAGSRYGAGKAIVSGNLLVNELHDQLRGVSIEGGRDVLISGNKIVNGWIRKGGDARNKCAGGTVTILGNEFLSDLPMQHSMVGLTAGTNEAIIKDNVMRFTRGQPAATTRREVAEDGKDEAENARAEERLQTDLPAISTSASAKTLSLLLVEGNVIRGYSGDVIQVRAAQPETDPLRLIVRRNTLEGAIRITGQPTAYRHTVADNLDFKTLAASEPIVETQEPSDPVEKPK